MTGVTTTGANEPSRPEGGDVVGAAGAPAVPEDAPRPPAHAAEAEARPSPAAPASAEPAGSTVATLVADDAPDDEARGEPQTLSTPQLSLRERLCPPMPTDRAAGWLTALLITVFAGILRFRNLGDPPQIVFDETYYAKDAYSLLKHGYERAVVSVPEGETPIDAQILDGRTDIFDVGPSYVVHPPVGKWVIALGEGIFGLTPFGWRFGVALVGTLTVLLLTRIARRLFRSTLLGAVAGFLLAIDGLAIVLSRTALLDGPLAFFLVAAFGCLLLDRDRSRAKLADLVEQQRTLGTLRPGGPRLGIRWWQVAAGICFGLACATKWSGVFVLAVCGLLVVAWDIQARRIAGVRRPYSAGVVYDGVPAFVRLVVVAVGAYLVSWTGWFLADNSHDRQWAAGQGDPVIGLVNWQLPSWLSWLAPDALRSLWHYHGAMLGFHNGLNLEESPHPYAAAAYRWLFLGRPTQFEFSQIPVGEGQDLPSGVTGTPEQMCGAARCARDIIAVGTPAIWWAGCIALVVLVALWLGRRDWRAAAVLALVGATWLPWLRWSDRPIFFFYAVAIVPFLILAVTLVLGYVLGPPGADRRRRRWGAIAVGAYVLVALLNSLYFYPVFTGEWIPYDGYSARMWFNFWV
jgi:dolichyl-phosphate-mannose-protein mannosyltransferase